jgi:hypothetical protein
MFSARRRLVAGAAGVAVLAGAGGAYAATQQGGSSGSKPDRSAEQKAFLDDLANRLHVSTDDLNAAIKGAAADRIDAAVAAGRLTKAQGDALKQRLQNSSGGLPFLGLRGRGGPGGPGGPGPGPGPGPGLRFGFGPGKSLDAAAKFLGLTDAQLRTQLRSGKSLADVAKAQGKSVTDLEAAMKSSITSELDQEVKAGTLTDAQRTKILQNLGTSLDRLVNGPVPQAPRFRGFRPPHHP